MRNALTSRAERAIAGVAIGAGVLASGLAAPASAVEPSSRSYTSIFTGPDATFAGAGWATCPTPITWDADVSTHSRQEARAQIANLRWALEEWGDASGLSFTYSGTSELVFDDASFALRDNTAVRSSERHISFAFISAQESRRLTRTVVGLGSPSSVWPGRNEITSGAAVFSSDYISRASRREARALLLHEIGHVLGLGHTDDPDQVMHAQVHTGASLGAGDVEGVRNLVKTCTAGA